MRFSSYFGVYSTSLGECRHWVEVKLSENLGLNGYRYCGKEAPKSPLRSVSNTVLITFRAPEDVITTYRRTRGFKIMYHAEYNHGESTAAPESSTSFHWKCSFETADGKSTFCGMTQSTYDVFDWSLIEGPTPSEETGPTVAMSKPYYAFIETSDPRRPADVAS